MYIPDDRTFLDMKQWSPHIGKTYYELHPKDKNQYRTYYIRWNAFMNSMHSFPSNYITGVPPEGMKPMHPMLISQLNKVPQFRPF